MYSASELHRIKETVGAAAAQDVLDGMQVGLGTGSTSLCFLEALLDRLATEHLHIQVLCSSLAIRRRAAEAGLTILPEESTTSLDLYVDGADWVDTRGALIKGGGGALLREKITAAMSKRFLVIVDLTKLVQDFRGKRLPLEILPYGASATQRQLTALGAAPLLRRMPDFRPYVSDNGNWIVDVQLPSAVIDPVPFVQRIMECPGCLGHGLFMNMADELLVGQPDGTVTRSPLNRK